MGKGGEVEIVAKLVDSIPFAVRPVVAEKSLFKHPAAPISYQFFINLFKAERGFHSSNALIQSKNDDVRSHHHMQGSNASMTPSVSFLFLHTSLHPLS